MMLAQLELDGANMTFAVPNGMHTSSRHAKRMVSEGMRAGVPDILCPIASNEYIGLAIEMKIPPNKSTRRQEWFQGKLAKHGWMVTICTSGSSAFITWANYLGITDIEFRFVADKFGFGWYVRDAESH